MMKNTNISYFLSAILLMTLLPSCSKSDRDDRTERIVFSAVVGSTTTKAGASVYSGSDFGTYAWKTSGTWESTSDDAKLSTPYMSNVQTTKTGDKWIPGTYRWPSGTSYLHFACYAPYKSSSPMTYSVADGITISNYTIDYSKAFEDILYSDLAKNNSNAIVFHHALCQMVFNIKKDNVPSGLTSVVSETTVVLDSLVLTGVRNVGTFKQNSTPVWGSQSGNITYTVFPNASHSGSQTLTTSDLTSDTIYVIPQDFVSDVQAIRLKYSVSLKYANGTTVSKNNIWDTHYFSDLSLSNSWQNGKQIVYSVVLSAFGDELSFSSSVEDWTNQTVTGNLGGGLND